MIDYSKLEDFYKPELINYAIRIAKGAAHTWPEDYVLVKDFEPHAWVVAAICESLRGR